MERNGRVFVVRFSASPGALVLLMTAALVSSSPGAIIERVSLPNDPTLETNGPSVEPSISADGRYVAFSSDASNLVADDTNNVRNVFVRDRTAGVTVLISRPNDRLQLTNGDSSAPSITPDGRFVVFVSLASNLTNDDTNTVSDIFVCDRDPDGDGILDEEDTDPNRITRISVPNDPAAINNGNSIYPRIDASGRWVVFASLASNLVDGGDGPLADVFVRDRDPDGNGVFDEGNGVTILISRPNDPTQKSNGLSSMPSISGSGRLIAFYSTASNLVNGDTNGVTDIFLCDRDPDGDGAFDEADDPQILRIVSIPNDRAQQSNGSSLYPNISTDGRYVAFTSLASNLVSGDANGVMDIFLYDREGDTTELVSVGPNGMQFNGQNQRPFVSDDGRWVGWDSVASNGAGNFTRESQLFVRDRHQGSTTLVSSGEAGRAGNQTSRMGCVSADGRYVAFYSYAFNLVPGDTNNTPDVFVHDLQTRPPLVRQPDAQIRRNDRLDFRGNDVYGTLEPQTSTQAVAAGATGVYQVLLENDGNWHDWFRIMASAAPAGWTVRYYEAPTGGAEITAAISSPSGLTIGMAVDGFKEVRIEATPVAGTPPGATVEVLVTIESLSDPTRTDTVRAVTTVLAVPSVPGGRVYTADADFDEGDLVGLEHEAVHDQLQLTVRSGALPFIWVPNSNEGTVSKLDTRTGRELGRYRTGPLTTGSPSRTTVDLDGNCWVGNRVTGTVVKIGLLESGGYVDRNGNGVIDTSRDLNGDGMISDTELLPWGEDECVLWEVVLISGYAEGPYVPGTYTGTYANDGNNPGPRGLGVDADNNVWAGTYGTWKYYYLDGKTGRILRTIDLSSIQHSAYGAVVDENGILWSSGCWTGHVLRLDPKLPDASCFTTIWLGHIVYGLGLDCAGHLFAGGWDTGKLTCVDRNASSVLWSITGGSGSRGVAVTDDGDVWVAESFLNAVTRWSNDGTQQKARIAVGNTPTGVAVDGEGKVWAVNLGDSFVSRIDPATNTVDLSRSVGNGHYGYSDMTGKVACSITARRGTWSVVHDCLVPDTPWGTVSWTADTPAGTSIIVRARSSNDRVNWSPWEAVANGVALSATPTGRFLQVHATLQGRCSGGSPVLYDLTVEPAPLIFRPDMLVRNIDEVAYTGDGVYDPPQEQSNTQAAGIGVTPAIYHLQVQNDGNLPDTITLTATPGDGQWIVRYYDALRGGAEITEQITGGGWTPARLAAGAAVQFRAEVRPAASLSPGSSKELIVAATSIGDPSRADRVRLVTTAEAFSLPGPRTYTVDADFDEGALVGLEHEAVHDQLQLAAQSGTLPFIWVPNSNEGTVSKIDTATGAELARYRTGLLSTGNPSRTTVDLQGNCWVANRVTGTVVKIGLFENGGYEDRDHDGVIDTSCDTNGDGTISPDEVLPWGRDECVLWEVVLISGKENTYVPGTYTGGYTNDSWNPGPRGIAVDAANHVWAGTYGTRKYYYINGTTGQILRSVDVSSVGHTPYGAVIDGDGFLWSSSGAGHVLRLNTADDTFLSIPLPHTVYGIALDHAHHLFVAGWTAGKLSCIDTSADPPVVLWTKDGKYQSRGVAVTDDGDVWVADSGPNTVSRYANDGTPKTTINVGSVPTGVAVDAAGKVWAVDYGDEDIHRIDPATNSIDLTKRIVGGYHYGYSDMTGVVAATITVKTGTWTVIHDAKAPDVRWGVLTWNREAPGPDYGQPPGTSITVRVRSSNDRQNWSVWEAASNGKALAATPAGRFLQVQVTLQRIAASASAILTDLTVRPLVWADSDGDGDVDIADFLRFQDCFNGPNRPPKETGCDGFDFDLDADVDIADFLRFQDCFNGPNRPPRC